MVYYLFITINILWISSGYSMQHNINIVEIPKDILFKQVGKYFNFHMINRLKLVNKFFYENWKKNEICSRCDLYAHECNNYACSIIHNFDECTKALAYFSTRNIDMFWHLYLYNQDARDTTIKKIYNISSLSNDDIIQVYQGNVLQCTIHAFQLKLLRKILHTRNIQQAKLIISTYPFQLLEFYNKNTTLLEKICKINDFALFKIFIEMNHEELNKYNNTNWPILHLISATGNINMIKEVEKYSINMFTRNFNLQTAMHIAAIYGKKNILDFLYKKGIHINTPDMWGNTVLHDTVRNGHYHALLKLLQYSDIDILIVNHDKRTALHEAAIRGANRSTTALLHKGIPINAQDIYGKTALHYAIEHGKKNTTNILLDYGANAYIRDNINKSPIHYIQNIKRESRRKSMQEVFRNRSYIS